MNKTFDDVISALMALEGGQELVDAAKARVTKVNDEAKSLRTRLHATEAKMAKVFELAGLDVATEDDALEDAFKSVSSKKQDDSALLKMQKQIDQLLNEKKTAESKLFDKEVSEKVLEKLAGKKVIDGFRNPIKDILKSKVRNDNGRLVYRADDGTEVDFDEGIDSYITANPSLIANDQNSGGGTKPPSGGGTTVKSIKQSDLDKLPFAEKHKLVSVDKVEIVQG